MTYLCKFFIAQIFNDVSRKLNKDRLKGDTPRTQSECPHNKDSK